MLFPVHQQFTDPLLLLILLLLLLLLFGRLMGVVFRYGVLFPLRFFVLITSVIVFLILFFLVKTLMPKSKRKLAMEQALVRFLAGMFVASWTGVIRFHGPRPTPGAGKVWVANHTSMIDYIILASYRPFAVIMQLHPGWVGFLQTQVLDSLGCVYFNRTQVRAWGCGERREGGSSVVHKGGSSRVCTGGRGGGGEGIAEMDCVV